LQHWVSGPVPIRAQTKPGEPHEASSVQAIGVHMSVSTHTLSGGGVTWGRQSL
jgi:hypothetical protein